MAKRDRIPVGFLQGLGQRMLVLFQKSDFKTYNELFHHLNGAISPATLTDLFKGQCNITAYNLAMIVRALGGSLDQVVFGKEQPKPSLQEFRKLLEQAEEGQLNINDKEVRQIITLLGEKKRKHKGLFEIIFKLLKEKDDKKISVLINMIEVMLGTD